MSASLPVFSPSVFSAVKAGSVEPTGSLSAQVHSSAAVEAQNGRMQMISSSFLIVDLVTSNRHYAQRPQPVGNVSENNNYSLRPLEERDAHDIILWRYEQPYDFYNPPDDNRGDHYVAQFLNPEMNFHAIVDKGDRFIGFCSFGADGQVPGGDYSEEALDIGLGMKPELTGQGRGFEFFEAIIKHATYTMMACRIRLTVADFNQRAMRLYEKFGFTETGQFIDALFDVPYTVLVRDS